MSVYGYNRRSNYTGSQDLMGSEAYSFLMGQTLGIRDLTGSFGERVFTDEGQIGKSRLQMNMNYANRKALERRQSRVDQLEEFSAESDRFNMQLGQTMSAIDSLDQRFLQNEEKISSMLAGFDSAPDKASSLSQYSQMAQRSMQETQRAISSLDQLKAPQAGELKTSFIDPFSGQEVDLGTNFEDVYRGTNSREIAREMVESDFKRRRSDIRSTLMNDLFDTDSFRELQSNFMGNDARSGTNRKLLEDAISVYASGDQGINLGRIGLEERGLISRFDPNAEQTLRGFASQIKGYEELDSYASAAAIAAMTGQKGFSSYQRNRDQIFVNPAEYYMGSDINAELDQIVDYTTSKLDVERLEDRAQFQAEFDARKERAIRGNEATMRNQKLNEARQAGINEKKQQLQQRLMRQQQEMQRTIAGNLGGEGSATGVRFTDTRPS